MDKAFRGSREFLRARMRVEIARFEPTGLGTARGRREPPRTNLATRWFAVIALKLCDPDDVLSERLHWQIPDATLRERSCSSGSEIRNALFGSL